MKSSSFIDIVIGHNNKLITCTSNTNFLGIVIQNSLPCKAHVDHLVFKLCTACYAIKAINPLNTELNPICHLLALLGAHPLFHVSVIKVKPFMSLDTLKLVYYPYFHSLMNYIIIFWGTSSHSLHVFRLQKMVIWIITRSRHRDSCRK
jgi:hypothetical protein